ncbi:PD-(D/E)XK motif protein [Methylophaga sp. OBS1]|uniref:PD-(D/E)XK motif protein n=1 Tax=Methylophaga sp. OBS1 TaxID=2991933 RepID=UPI002257153B|nr:PD-(D/E)XK motif protein [Methylophaga sp. OBS1]MCX4191015.1 PD-(D/E)XK motif protein [Methylophaga sp. OBS1]MCX4192039.1 PD-(D/E)XK motif protein [Methylophaga sp. OBS1]
MTASLYDFFKDDPWADIEQGTYPKSARRLYSEDDRFWVSVDEAGQKLFFIEEPVICEVDTDLKVSCLRVDMVKMNSSTRLVCTLVEDELKDKFSTVTKDIAHYCSSHQGLKLFQHAVERILSWGEFLKPSREGLRHSELVGFWGELYTLKKHISPHLQIDKAVSGWVGPLKKKQDFTLGETSIEVKTSQSGDGNEIRISSLEQLQKRTEKLYLLTLRIVNTKEQDDLSLEDLYLEIVQELEFSPVSKRDFLQKAASLYGKATQSQLKTKFIEVDHAIYEVDDDFPRLVPENIPGPSIVRVSYSIDENALGKHRILDGIKDLLSDG